MGNGDVIRYLVLSIQEFTTKNADVQKFVNATP